MSHTNLGMGFPWSWSLSLCLDYPLKSTKHLFSLHVSMNTVSNSLCAYWQKLSYSVLFYPVFTFPDVSTDVPNKTWTKDVLFNTFTTKWLNSTFFFPLHRNKVNKVNKTEVSVMCCKNEKKSPSIYCLWVFSFCPNLLWENSSCIL